MEKSLDELGPPLYYTVLSGCFQLSNLLIENGVDIDAQGGLYGRALQAAAYEGDKSMVQVLLDHSAEINAKEELMGVL